MEIFLVVTYIIFSFVILAGLPPFVQWRAFQANIDVKYFKKVKVTKLSFLFRGIGGKDFVGGDVKKDGVIIPMFILHILGYCVAFISTIIVLVLYLTKQIGYVFVLIFQSSLIVGEAILCLTMIYLCSIITKHRKKQEESFKE